MTVPTTVSPIEQTLDIARRLATLSALTARNVSEVARMDTYPRR